MFTKMYGSLTVLILGLVLFWTTEAYSIDFSDCGSDYDIKEVTIEGCRVIPCKLEIGSSYKINMTLRPIYRSDSLTQKIYITLLNVDLKVEVVPDNPCASLRCPVLVTERTTFSGTLTIPNYLPAAKGMLWWKMATNNGNSAVCIKTSVKVEEKSKSPFPNPSIIPEI